MPRLDLLIDGSKARSKVEGSLSCFPALTVGGRHPQQSTWMTFLEVCLFLAVTCGLAQAGARQPCIQREDQGSLTALLWTFYTAETDASVFNSPGRKPRVDEQKQSDGDRRWPTLTVMEPGLRQVAQIDRHRQCRTEDTSRRRKRSVDKGGGLPPARQPTPQHGLRAPLQSARRRLRRLLTEIIALYRRVFRLVASVSFSRRTKRTVATEVERKEDIARDQTTDSWKGSVPNYILSCQKDIFSFETKLRKFRRRLRKKRCFHIEDKASLSLLRSQLRLVDRLKNIVERAFPSTGNFRSGPKQPFRDRCQQYQTLDYDPDRFPAFIYRVECCSNKMPELKGYHCDQQFVYMKVLRPVDGCYQAVLEPVPIRCHFLPGKSTPR